MKIKDQNLQRFQGLETPFYYYDMDVLNSTLEQVITSAKKHDYHVHYALKANSNPKLLKTISQAGLGADCVSGNEILRALENGFGHESIVFAGVGKTDREIKIALEKEIFCFNCESIEEIKIINEIADSLNKTAQIAVRINPNVQAHTHKYITTGLDENKFGISPSQLTEVISVIKESTCLKFIGIHFHIGSQITDLNVFKDLSLKVNEIVKYLDNQGISIQHINLGGGLGINYQNPELNLIPDFDTYFDIFNKYLECESYHQIHFELGRSIVGQCGSLISRVTFIKEALNTSFAILDAGMTELMRPALYNSEHNIETLTYHSDSKRIYDVVGPICESSDSFRKGIELNTISRGDLIAIRSAGAYGEAMGSNYNLRDKAKSYFS